MKVYNKINNTIIDIKLEHLSLMLNNYKEELEIYDEKKHNIEKKIEKLEEDFLNKKETKKEKKNKDL